MEINFPKREKQILKFWKENRIFEKSVSQRKNAKDFVFYEGPPTANGRPGIHHVESRVFKDIICRYKTMQGFLVQRKAGWDTHGLPVELEVEKKLGLKNKKDIESYGVARFNKKCKESVWQYLKDWKKLTERIGFWLDLENPYITYETNYIESVWFVIKQIFKKGLLYLGYKVVPYCPRCGTSLSSHEVAQGYERIKEPAIFVKFRIKNPEFQNTFLLVWTTTPWTLPGNVAVAVNPRFVYVKVRAGNESLILAKERLEAGGLKGAEILQELKGEELLKIYYEASYPVDSQEGVTIYKVIPADFVSLEDGTGLVHIAPAFGEDDMAAIKTQNSKIKKQNEPDFPILLPVDESGKFRLEAKKWAGIFVKDADPLIIEDLRDRGLLYKEELYEHDYPFCWRCKSPLLYYAKQGWFVNMQEEIKENLIKNNQEINWVPSHLKNGRFGEWLKDIKDWAISRERYWGTPLPVWKCKTCGTFEAIGSRKDLASQKFSQNRFFVVRHGESLRNKKNIYVCWPERIHCPLTKKGELQVKRLAGKLKKQNIDLIISSDLLRTKQTAEILAKDLGLKVKFDKRLREINVGILNGKLAKEGYKFWQKKERLSPLEYTKERFKTAPPGGENYLDVEKRLYGFVKSVEKEYGGKNILIVSHQRPITLLEKILTGQSLEEFVDVLVGKKEIKTGEARELEFAKLPYSEKMELDFHKPYIDEVKFYCPKCGGQSERVPEVIDCWFDSGSMPFAQGHWVGGNPPRLFPADYISEAIDQTRGWFYTLLAISTLLGFESPYKNVISLGHVLDEKGEKMSKSKGNIVDPWYIIEKYGVDAARWYFYTINQPGESKLFTEKDVDATLKKFILTFWNCYTFFETYSPTPTPRGRGSDRSVGESKNILDKWIISKLNETIKEVTDALDKYDVTLAARTIEKFTIDELSLWYIRRSRRRFHPAPVPPSRENGTVWGRETRKDFMAASQTLGFVLLTLSRIMAPFVPFVSEEIYQGITGAGFVKKKSVHLDKWPEIKGKLINKKLNEDMEKVREIVALALAERSKAAIKVRQPLQKLKIQKSLAGQAKFKISKELLDLIKEEINVKEIVFNEKMQKEMELDTEITPELKEEGIIREVVRNIQEMRKKSNLKPKDDISVRYSGDAVLGEILKKNEKAISEEGKIRDFLPGKGAKGFKIQQEVMVDGKKILISIKKLK